MSGRAAPLLLSTLTLAACRARPGDPASGPAPAPPPPVTMTAGAEAPAAASSPAPGRAEASARTLIVGGEQGLREVGYDGTVVRVLSKTPASRPRALPGGKELLFYARAAGELHLVSRETGKERLVAALPRSFKTCGHLPDYPAGHAFAVAALDVQEDADFVLESGGRAACMRLQDRNANMVNVQIALRVDLGSGAVLHRVEIGGDCAKAPPTWEACPPPPYVPPAGPPFPLASLGLGPPVTEESVAPGGRWSVLAVPAPSGDYIHRWLFLLDRQGKRVFPLAAGPFPSPLAPAALTASDGGPSTVDAVGESAVRWLDGDALLVDDLLVVPGKQAVKLPGDVAR